MRDDITKPIVIGDDITLVIKAVKTNPGAMDVQIRDGTHFSVGPGQYLGVVNDSNRVIATRRKIPNPVAWIDVYNTLVKHDSCQESANAICALFEVKS